MERLERFFAVREVRRDLVERVLPSDDLERLDFVFDEPDEVPPPLYVRGKA